VRLTPKGDTLFQKAPAFTKGISSNAFKMHRPENWRRPLPPEIPVRPRSRAKEEVKLHHGNRIANQTKVGPPKTPEQLRNYLPISSTDWPTGGTLIKTAI